jgi:hypothetical protein
MILGLFKMILAERTRINKRAKSPAPPGKICQIRGETEQFWACDPSAPTSDDSSGSFTRVFANMEAPVQAYLSFHFLPQDLNAG